MEQYAAAILFGAIALTAACSDSPTSPSEGGSRFVLRLSGSSLRGGQALFVTVVRVRALRSSGFVDVPFPGGAAQFTCDLKTLQSSDGEIASGSLPPSPYTEVRLQIQSATLYLDNSTSEPACGASSRAPSGRAAPMTVTPSEVSLASQFRIEENGDTTMRIGVNPEQSVRQNGDGSYTFAPAIAVLSVS
jgi:hypothetical protein